jgi:hypothetical protein
MDFEDMFDEKELEDALSYDPDVIKGEVELANQACDYWKSIYPVEHDERANPPRPPGTGRDSIHVIRRRRYVAVRAEDPIAHILEYGSVQVPEYATRARTEEYFNKGGGGDRVGE